MKKIFKTIGLICMAVVVAVGSVFIAKKDTENQINIASASLTIDNVSFDSPAVDSTFTPSYLMTSVNKSSLSFYTHSSYYLPYIGFNGASLDYTASSYVNYLLSCLDFGFSSSVADDFIYVHIYLSGYSILNDCIIAPIGCTKSYPNGDTNFNSDYFYGISTFYINTLTGDVTSHNCILSFYNSLTDIVVPFYCFVDTPYDLTSVVPSLNMQQFTIIISDYISNMNFSSDIISYLNTRFSSSYYVCSFTDTTGYRFNICFPLNTIVTTLRNYSDNLLIPYRCYDFTDLSDDVKYERGYQQGLADNQKNIYNQGYLAGRTIGYGEGHSAGVNDSNTYTFTGLIGAVLNVPVSVFNSLLDYNLLGVNLKSFALSIFSVCVILFIIRKLKGGR